MPNLISDRCRFFDLWKSNSSIVTLCSISKELYLNQKTELVIPAFQPFHDKKRKVFFQNRYNFRDSSNRSQDMQTVWTLEHLQFATVNFFTRFKNDNAWRVMQNGTATWQNYEKQCSGMCCIGLNKYDAVTLTCRKKYEACCRLCQKPSYTSLSFSQSVYCHINSV